MNYCTTRYLSSRIYKSRVRIPKSCAELFIVYDNVKVRVLVFIGGHERGEVVPTFSTRRSSVDTSTIVVSGNKIGVSNFVWIKENSKMLCSQAELLQSLSCLFSVHLVINEKYIRPNYLCIHRIKYCFLSTYQKLFPTANHLKCL